MNSPTQVEVAAFLRLVYATQTSSATTTKKPFVTLSYAQSLDGLIADENGHQIILSGHQSMTLTHRYGTATTNTTPTTPNLPTN